jgi:hypothetical protein
LPAGPNGQRHGFTAERILESDRDALTAIATASARGRATGCTRTRPDRLSGRLRNSKTADPVAAVAALRTDAEGIGD